MSASEDGRLGQHTHLAWSALFLHPQGPAVVGGVGSAPGMPEGGPPPPSSGSDSLASLSLGLCAFNC